MEQLRADLRERYPLLVVTRTPIGTRVSGPVPVVDDGQELARFQLEIECGRQFPRAPPFFREVGALIPNELDRHMVPSKKSFCLYIPAYYWLYGYDRRPLSDLLDGPVRSYLVYQLCVEADRPWPYGELEHDEEGELRFFDDLFDTDRRGTKAFLRALRAGLRPGSRCPCSSGREVRACHSVCLELLSCGARSYVLGLARRVA